MGFNIDKIKQIFLVILVLILILYSQKTEIRDLNKPWETNKPIEVFFCKQDNCTDILIKNQLEKCAFYTMSNKDLKIDKLITKDDVKKRPMHNKFCVTGETIITGSYNPEENQQDNNNLIMIHSKYLSENYKKEFEEIWWKKPDEKTKYTEITLNNQIVKNYFCPDDNCEEVIIKEIKKAQREIYFMTFSFTNQKIAEALIQKSNITIKGIMEKFQKGEHSMYERLKNNGIQVKWDGNTWYMHHKVFIIDNETVITGSANPTKSGMWENDENIIIIKSKRIAKKFLEEFNRI